MLPLGKQNRLAATLVIVASALACVLPSNASSRDTEIPMSMVTMAFRQSVVPKQLSRTGTTPIALKISGRPTTLNGSQPPGLEEMVLDFDRNITFDARGLPSCRPPLRDIRDPAQWSSCREAVVGRGRVEVGVQLPEIPPTVSDGEFKVFNGGPDASGKTTLYAPVHLVKPITTEFVITITLRPDGHQAIVAVPRLLNGAGSLTYLSAQLERHFTKNDEASNLLTASCPDGMLQSAVRALLGDGTEIRADILQRCVPSPTKRSSA